VKERKTAGRSTEANMDRFYIKGDRNLGHINMARGGGRVREQRGPYRAGPMLAFRTTANHPRPKDPTLYRRGSKKKWNQETRPKPPATRLPSGPRR
jgi:hypothetical protein